MKKLYVVALLLWAMGISLAFAQADFRPAYIISFDQDTVFGEIDFNADSRNYQYCRFQKEGSMLRFTAEDILAYGFENDKRFRSGIVPGIFVEELLTGPLSLYRHHTVLYVKDEWGRIRKLEEKEREVRVEDRIVMYEDFSWKGTLTLLLSGCGFEREKMEHIPFHEHAIAKLINRYNACQGHPSQYVKAKKSLLKFKLGVLAGVNAHRMTTNEPNTPYTIMKNRYRSFNPTLGATFSVYFPRFSERLSFHTELLYTENSFSSTVERDIAHAHWIHHVHIESQTLAIPFYVQYEFPEKALPLFFQIGMEVDHFLHHKHHVLSERIIDQDVAVFEGKPFVLRPQQASVLLGMGVQKSFSRVKLRLMMRYTHAVSEVNDSLDLSVYIHKFSVMLGLSMK